MSAAMGADRWRIKSELKRLQTLQNPGEIARRLAVLENRLGRSAATRARRLENRPRPAGAPQLPIAAQKSTIISAINRHPVVIIAGETGSGKTTQIPQFCLEAGRGIDGMIGCTQPRRIAAITVATRIAEELGERPGKGVGYKIRFQDRSAPGTYIKVMTDGILLAETQNDPLLLAYDTLIVDEAHERSLNIDFILGWLRRLVEKRDDLKVIVTSATIDTEKFSEAFGNAPIIEISGRMFPVKVHYRPVASENADDAWTHVESAVAAVETLQNKGPSGDILIFMPTEADIRETCELLSARVKAPAVILPLFARLPAEAQSRVFAPVAGRKIIVATNIAETSITIPGIRYVVDTGLARISRYSPRTRTTSLPVVSISRSSADQRMGRCGRVQNGVCIRLFAQDDYLARPVFTPPEILRANLAEVILRMIALRLGDVRRFPFIDPPGVRSVSDGFDVLEEIEAIAPGRKKGGYVLTPKGKIMARLPIDPRLSRMLIEAGQQGCLAEVTVIAAALSIPDPRQRPPEKAKEADRAHALFADPLSDFISLLNLWNRYRQTWAEENRMGALKRFCNVHFLSFRRMREWHDIQAQITDMLAEHGIADSQPRAEPRSRPNDGFSPLYAAIHRAVLSGFLANIAVKKENNLYQATKAREVMIFPGSALFNRAGRWIVAAEMIKTSRLFARQVASIDAPWLETVGRHLCRYSYLDPHWDKDRGEVVASEQVSLYGLIIVSGRRVGYGRIAPEASCDIFIRQGLMAQELAPVPGFLAHNVKQMTSVQDLENRFRRKDLLVDEAAIFDFYRKRLEGVFDIRSLRRRIRDAGGDHFLRMRRDDLLCYLPDPEQIALYPDQIQLGERNYACTYHFDPGSPKDGVTVTIAAAEAPTVPVSPIEWGVPGLLQEKITTLIKGLSKPYRKKLVPITATVQTIVTDMPKTAQPLTSALGRFIHERFGVDIPSSAWPGALPEHLVMRIAIVDPGGSEIRASRQPSLLRRPWPQKVDMDDFKCVKTRWEKTGIIELETDEIPEAVELKSPSGTPWMFYPGLTLEADGIALRLYTDRGQALQIHKKGVAALFARHFAADLKYLKKSLVLSGDSAVHAQCLGGPRAVEKTVYEALFDALFARNIRSRGAFQAHAADVAKTMMALGQQRIKAIWPVLAAVHEARSGLGALESGHKTAIQRQFLQKRRDELQQLVPADFARVYAPDRMPCLSRYVRAILIRAQRGISDLEKDRRREMIAGDYARCLAEFIDQLTPETSAEKRQAVEAFFWLVEEFKVSVFAQELKTAVPVSRKRLDRMAADIQRMV